MRHSLGELVLSPTLWIHVAIVYCLRDPRFYLLGINTGIVLDWWRHSSLLDPADHPVARWLRWALVTPELHALHHASVDHAANFGANFTFWDRLHDTFRRTPDSPVQLGVTTNDHPVRLLFWFASAPVAGRASRDASTDAGVA